MSYSIIQNVCNALIEIRYLREFLFRHFIYADAFYVMILLINNLLGPLVCLYCCRMHHFITRNYNSIIPSAWLCFFTILDHRYLRMLHPSFVYIYETKLVLMKRNGGSGHEFHFKMILCENFPDPWSEYQICKYFVRLSVESDTNEIKNKINFFCLWSLNICSTISV